jgi:hypothetical protein
MVPFSFPPFCAIESSFDRGPRINNLRWEQGLQVSEIKSRRHQFLTSFLCQIDFFSRSGKSKKKKPDLYVPRWMGAYLTYLELSAGKDKQVIAF